MESFNIYGQIISHIDWHTYQAKSNITVSTRWTIVRAKEFHRFLDLYCKVHPEFAWMVIC
jgi:hypothetical protein